MSGTAAVVVAIVVEIVAVANLEIIVVATTAAVETVVAYKLVQHCVEDLAHLGEL